MEWETPTKKKRTIRPDKAQLGEQEEQEDRGRGGRTTSESGQAWTSQGSRRQAEVEMMSLRVKGLMMMMNG